jgi:hypothetical protein
MFSLFAHLDKITDQKDPNNKPNIIETINQKTITIL